jgi:hypothetical protein
MFVSAMPFLFFGLSSWPLLHCFMVLLIIWELVPVYEISALMCQTLYWRVKITIFLFIVTHAYVPVYTKLERKVCGEKIRISCVYEHISAIIKKIGS